VLFSFLNGGFFLFLGYRGILHPASDDEDTERTWVEPEQRPRKRVLKRSVHGKQDVHSMPAGANKDTRPKMCERPALSR